MPSDYRRVGEEVRAHSDSLESGGEGRLLEPSEESDENDTYPRWPAWPPLASCEARDASERDNPKGDQWTRRRFCQWLMPGFLFVVCFFFQNVGLHIATYYYVIWMDRLHDHVQGQGALEQQRENLSTSVDNGALQDAFTDWMNKRIDVPMTAMDLISGMVPVVFLVCVVRHNNIRLWTRCCICASILALLKGLLAASTVVPDSSGWESCKERLGPAGMKFFRESHSLNFEHGILRSFMRVLTLEVQGVYYQGSNHHLRYCADMMFSGHTYVCSIFSLGLFDFVCSHTANHRCTLRICYRFLVGMALLFIVCLDMLLILVNRFHYTMDVIVAVVLVLLLFSNPAVAMAAEWWTAPPVNRESRSLDASSGTAENEAREWEEALEQDRGEILVPPCCFPLCWFHGRYHLHSRPDLYSMCSVDLREKYRELTQKDIELNSVRLEVEHYKNELSPNGVHGKRVLKLQDEVLVLEKDKRSAVAAKQKELDEANEKVARLEKAQEDFREESFKARDELQKVKEQLAAEKARADRAEQQQVMEVSGSFANRRALCGVSGSVAEPEAPQDLRQEVERLRRELDQARTRSSHRRTASMPSPTKREAALRGFGDLPELAPDATKEPQQPPEAATAEAATAEPPSAQPTAAAEEPQEPRDAATEVLPSAEREGDYGM